MARHRRLGRVVVDTSVVIRAARAFRQQPPEPNTPELRLVLAWRDDPEVFTWLYSQEILTEYREILRRLKVPRNAAGQILPAGPKQKTPSYHYSRRRRCETLALGAIGI